MSVRRVSLLALSLAAVSAILLAVSISRSAGNANAQGEESQASVALDMDVTNGDGPCNPVDDSYSVGVGQTYEVAVCLLDASQAPAELQFDLIYNDDLNRCVPQECTSEICVDSNPDANSGATTWGDTSLGPNWDCHYMGESPPTCDSDPAQGEGHGLASLLCLTLDEQPSLRVGDGVASPIALVTFEATTPGEDTLTLNDAELYSSNLVVIVSVAGSKNPADEGTVSIGAEVTPTSEASPPAETPAAGETPGSEVPTENPNAGPTATAAAATAVAQGTPIAAINQAATATSAAVATKAASASKTPSAKATAKPGAGNKSGDEGSSGPDALLIAGIVVVAVLAVGSGGWFGYRRFRASR